MKYRLAWKAGVLDGVAYFDVSDVREALALFDAEPLLPLGVQVVSVAPVVARQKKGS